MSKIANMIKVDNWKFKAEYAFESDAIYLDSLVVKRRRKGYGTAFMKSLIEMAKEKKLDIALLPSTMYGANEVRLIKFYERLGFKENINRSLNKNWRYTYYILKYHKDIS